MEIGALELTVMISLLVTAQANVLRVSHVERCFGASGVPLQRSGRVLLGEGLLTKVGHGRSLFVVLSLS